jgi:hypothetical protein
MKVETLQIAWHGGKAVLCASCHPSSNRLATGGADNVVRVAYYMTSMHPISYFFNLLSVSHALCCSINPPVHNIDLPQLGRYGNKSAQDLGPLWNSYRRCVVIPRVLTPCALLPMVPPPPPRILLTRVRLVRLSQSMHSHHVFVAGNFHQVNC